MRKFIIIFALFIHSASFSFDRLKISEGKIYFQQGSDAVEFDRDASFEKGFPYCSQISCRKVDYVQLPSLLLEEIEIELGQVDSASNERMVLAEIIGKIRMVAMKKSHTEFFLGAHLMTDNFGYRFNLCESRKLNDIKRVGNFTDCWDNSHNTSMILYLLEKKGWLRFHQLNDIQLRWSLFSWQHYSGSLKEKSTGSIYIVDTWYTDEGLPPLILPIKEWKKKRTKAYLPAAMKSPVLERLKKKGLDSSDELYQWIDKGRLSHPRCD